MAQRVGRGIALPFHDRGTRRGRVVSSTPRPHFTPGKDRVPILQEAGWAPGPVLTGGKSRPHRDSIPDYPARSSVAILTELPYPHVMLVLLNRKHNNSSLSTRSRQRLRRKCFVIQGIDNPCRLAYSCRSPHKLCFAPFNGVEANISTKYSLLCLGSQTKISVFLRFAITLGGQGKSPLHYISKLKSALKKYRLI